RAARPRPSRCCAGCWPCCNSHKSKSGGLSFKGVMSQSEDAIPFIQRIFRLAADRVGGHSQLGEHLGLTQAELAPYLRGEAMPPFRTLLSAVDLVVEQVNLADRPWQAVLASYQDN